jgi:anti-sigma B factor antagonist
MERLIISEERAGQDNSLTLLTLSGTIETTNASGLEDTMARIINEQCYRIVVDLGGVTYISSACWGIFISEIKRIRRNGGDIKLASMTPEVREVFELLEFNSILKPFNDTDSAVSDFAIAAERAESSDGDSTRAGK